MINNSKKRAYTLAEIMLVILVLTLIFAALAPIITKRRVTTSGDTVWQYASYETGDIQFAPSDTDYHSQLFFGVTPIDGSHVEDTLKPLAKLVIRSGNVSSEEKPQRQLHFRYGKSDSDLNGKFAGSWYVNKYNMLLGGAYLNLNRQGGTILDTALGAKNNVAIGYNALNRLTTGSENTAIGNHALASSTTAKRNVAIGYSAGKANNSTDNVYIGSNAGRGHTGTKSVYVGYNAGMGNHVGIKNLAIGAFAGGGLDGANVDFSNGKAKNGETQHSITSTTSTESITTGGGTKENTAIGYSALANIKSGEGNIAIGAYALRNLTTGSNNIAIGYNACSNLTTESNKTCIGYNSGPRKKSQGNKGSAFLLWDNYGDGNPRGDSADRVYIGAPPKNFGGDAVLELHNPKYKDDTTFSTNTTGGRAQNTTTVINGNLIINGRPYFTVGSTLYHFTDFATPPPATTLTPQKHSDMRTGLLSDGTNSSSTYIRYYGIPTQNPISEAAKSTYKNFSITPSEYAARETLSDGALPRFYNIETTSDRRLKNIGEKFQGGLNELKQLKVYNYTFKNDEKKLPQVGVIAQELQKIFPTAVAKGDDGYLRIRWDEMFYSVINAIKELDKRIIAITNKTIKIESKISKLEKENIELKTQIENLSTRVNKLKAQ